MRMPPDLLSAVKEMGFSVLTLANNHMMDYGEVAFHDTLSHLREHELSAVGAGVDIDAAWRAEVVSIGETKVAFLGAASTLGPGSAAAEGSPGIAPIHVSESYNVDFASSMEQPGSAPYVFTRAWREDLERAVAAIEAGSQRSASCRAGAALGCAAFLAFAFPGWLGRLSDRSRSCADRCRR